VRAPNVRKSGRVLCRPCLDWSERRPHLAGAVGAANCTPAPTPLKCEASGEGRTYSDRAPKRPKESRRTNFPSKIQKAASGRPNFENKMKRRPVGGAGSRRHLPPCTQARPRYMRPSRPPPLCAPHARCRPRPP
jgi:hypothetical protein